MLLEKLLAQYTRYEDVQTWKRAVRNGWLKLLLLAVCVAAAFFVVQILIYNS